MIKQSTLRAFRKYIVRIVFLGKGEVKGKKRFYKLFIITIFFALLFFNIGFNIIINLIN
jgi:hypothetical protein